MAIKFISSTIFVMTALVSSTTRAYQKASRCSESSLRIKDCSLETYGYRLHFLDDKVLLHNGIWRSIQNFPLSGEKITWSDIKVYRLLGRKFISFLLWGKPEGLTEIQSLNWYIYEVIDKKMTSMLHVVVQKRQKNHESKDDHAFSYDPKDHFGLKVVKKRVMWFHKGEAGILK